MIAKSQHFNEEQNPDPLLSKKNSDVDPDPH